MCPCIFICIQYTEWGPVPTQPYDVRFYAAVEGDDLGLHARVEHADALDANLLHQVASVRVVKVYILSATRKRGKGERIQPVDERVGRGEG